MLSLKVQSRQGLDPALNSNPQTFDRPISIPQDAKLNEDDLRIIQSVDTYLTVGLALKRWWDEASSANSFRHRFELQRVFNRPGRSFGFFDEVNYGSGTLPVMGNFQQMFYDQPRTPTSLQEEAAEWMRGQIREFVLHYFMRVSSFRQPETYVESDRPPASRLPETLSWCPEPDILQQGFGFSQLYYKLRDTGEVDRFEDEFAIIDLRELEWKYEWIVAKVRIFDFKFRFSPFGSDGPELTVPLAEESYLVLTHDFIQNNDDPRPGVLGEYGLGYAFIKNPVQGLFAYGPGEFDAAIETISFEVMETGAINVSMSFVVNRPERIMNVSLDPFNWSFRIADLFSFGLTSRLLAPLKDAFERVPTTNVAGFDPVLSYISLANLLTGNRAAQDLCISREQLEKDLLAQHFTQHYATIVGSLLTWRQIPDWLDSAALPEWVVTGRSS